MSYGSLEDSVYSVEYVGYPFARLLLWVAQPSKDDAALPRRFRTAATPELPGRSTPGNI